MSQTLASTGVAAHVVCMSAGVRDGLRTAQFYLGDLANADGVAAGEDRKAPFLSRAVAGLARFVDGFMTRGAKFLISIIWPSWRNLPSPFSSGVLADVSSDIDDSRLWHNPSFNAYFFRAAKHVLKRLKAQPSLVLEHRVDSSRRQLAVLPHDPRDKSEFLSRTLITLVKNQPVARATLGSPFNVVDANVAVFSIAAIALLLASEGRPEEITDENEFFAVTGALIAPHLPKLAELISAGDEKGLSAELSKIQATY